MEGKIKICLNFGFVEIGKVKRPFGFTLIRLAFSQPPSPNRGKAYRRVFRYYGAVG